MYFKIHSDFCVVMETSSFNGKYKWKVSLTPWKSDCTGLLSQKKSIAIWFEGLTEPRYHSDKLVQGKTSPKF